MENVKKISSIMIQYRNDHILVLFLHKLFFLYTEYLLAKGFKVFLSMFLALVESSDKTWSTGEGNGKPL